MIIYLLIKVHICYEMFNSSSNLEKVTNKENDCSDD